MTSTVLNLHILTARGMSHIFYSNCPTSKQGKNYCALVRSPKSKFTNQKKNRLQYFRVKKKWAKISFHRHFKDVRANCFCKSLPRTQIHKPRHASSVRSLISKCSVNKLVNWTDELNYFFWIIWLREFCGWFLYLEYEQKFSVRWYGTKETK